MLGAVNMRVLAGHAEAEVMAEVLSKLDMRYFSLLPKLTTVNLGVTQEGMRCVIDLGPSGMTARSKGNVSFSVFVYKAGTRNMSRYTAVFSRGGHVLTRHPSSQTQVIDYNLLRKEAAVVTNLWGKCPVNKIKPGEIVTLGSITYMPAQVNEVCSLHHGRMSICENQDGTESIYKHSGSNYGGELLVPESDQPRQDNMSMN